MITAEDKAKHLKESLFITSKQELRSQLKMTPDSWFITPDPTSPG